MLRPIFNLFLGPYYHACCAENLNEGLKIGDFQKQKQILKKTREFKARKPACCGKIR